MSPDKERSSLLPNPALLPVINSRAATPELMTELLHVWVHQRMHGRQGYE